MKNSTYFLYVKNPVIFEELLTAKPSIVLHYYRKKSVLF